MRRFLVALLLVLDLHAQGEAEVSPFDHAAAIQGLTAEDAKAGEKLYALHCASCHGVAGKLALNPLARRFASEPLKFGADPYALWKTISYGNGLMFRWDGILSEKERYQIVHHLREGLLKKSNKSQYTIPDQAYFDSVNARATKDAADQAATSQSVAVAPGMIDGSGGTRMQYGPFLQHGVVYGEIADKNAPTLEETTEKALIVSLGQLNICYDADRLSVSGLWQGPIANTEDTHHTSYKGSRPLMPSGTLLYKGIDTLGWTGGIPTLQGHYLHGHQVVLHYTIGRREVWELPVASGDTSMVRHLRVGPGNEALRCLVRTGNSISVSAHPAVPLETEAGATWLPIPPSDKVQIWSVSLGDTIPEKLEIPDVEALLKGGPRRWPQTVQTAVRVGENVEGYALDELTVPLANPYGSWMRPTALDFFEDGKLAVSTLSGDVWIVDWDADTPTTLTWSRFAAGLYEPLGLKVVDGKVYVRGRDRITRLHDLNEDGEADFYESFFEDRNEIGAGYHAFKYDLQTDEAGYFYYSQSGYKSPLSGAVVRVAGDGSHGQHIATDFRNPNGMGAGGPKGWITVADNPSGTAVYNGFSLAREGTRHGFEHQRNTPMLVVLPARVDSSSGGQCWADEKRWGPLSGSIIHGSYSQSAVFYCRTQDVGDYPNGFAMRLPFDLKAGVMRPRVSPVDCQVYLAAKKGWDSVAEVDGMIYRIRATDQPSHFVQEVSANRQGLLVTFACELDPASLDLANFSLIREPDKPTEEGEPNKEPISAVRLVNERSLAVDIPTIQQETLEHRTRRNAKGEIVIDVRPALSLTLKLRALDGTAIEQTIHATINSLE